MGGAILRMGQAKRYSSHRLFIHDSTKVPEGNDSGTPVLPKSAPMGNYGISFRAKHQLYYDSRLAFLPGCNNRFRRVYSQMVTALVALATIIAIFDSTGYKGAIIYLISLVSLVIYIYKNLPLLKKEILPLLRKYFNEDKN